uniref:RNase H type-1 domain-containing protein n=1 Tax=Nicotiana tabacum TaxID=4097 RepID=A0A1S4D094_TOBAC|nr:PREDICTED: uncharacterized protein LOC107824476 [Nicotiana tabacum]
MVAWHKPPAGSLKLNIDGAFSKNLNLAGLGGSFKDDHGQWIMGYQHHCPASLPLQCELEALKEGLQIALAHGFTSLVIETDSTEVVYISLFLSRGSTENKLSTSLKWFMHRLKEPKILHNFRDGNQVAHGLDKEALEKRMDHQLLDRPHTIILNKLDADRMLCLFC